MKILLKRRLKQKPLMVGLVALLALAALIFQFILRSPVQNDSLPPIASIITPYKQKEIKYGVPVHLKIPKIGVDAQVEPMGLTSSGDMEAPSGPKPVGWYRFGTRPGDVGSAVVDGHYGYWKSGERSVFQDLNKLKKGDSLYVKDNEGITSTFTVRELKIYDPEGSDSDVFKSNDGLAHLNLITCEGVWNAANKTYSNRLVVFTDKK